MNCPSRKRRSLLAFLFVTLSVSACSDQAPDADGPMDLESASATVTGFEVHQEVSAVMAAQATHTDELMGLPGVVGTAVGLNESGRPVMLVLVENPRVELPARLGGVGVRPLVTGKIYALQQAVSPRAKGGNKGKPGGGGGSVDPSARFDRPVPIGVSTGHPDITAGTIGARVTDGANVYALSNNHVYADENLASIGDAILQPGAFDGGSTSSDVIGTLFDFKPIDFVGGDNVIDAAIASVTSDELGNATYSGGYGTPKPTTMAAVPGMSVKKCGRTTGCTNGTVDAVNATVNVGYSSGVALFTGQIIITPGSFSDGGDSGSLIVVRGKGKNRADDNKPVGLLFAGSSTITIANPIDDVLDAFGVTIDGN